MSLGVIWQNARFWEGTSRTIAEALALRTRWHDKLFQLCEPSTMQVLDEAAVHSAPARGLDPELAAEPLTKRRQRRQSVAARTVLERIEAREAHRKRFRK